MGSDYKGQETRETQSAQFNTFDFMIAQALARMSCATLVQVKAVTTTGQVAATGTVDVQPLVKMQTSDGVQQPHGQLYKLPYFRYQGGGNKAVIMDPKAGDIGVAIFCDRDISAAKANKKESQAGSFRQHDMADGLYFGCFLGEKPTVYVRFTDDDKIIAAVATGGESSRMEVVVADTHVQMKQFGAPNMHLTIDKPTGQILAGQPLVIAPDPYPGD